MLCAGQFLSKQLGAGLLLYSLHQKFALFNYLLPVSLLVFLLGSLAISVAINVYLCSLTSMLCQQKLSVQLTSPW